MKKTLILLIISLILLLVGCGSDSDSNNSDKGLIDQETERIKNEIDKANSMAGVKSTPEPTKEQEPAEPTEIISTPEVQKTLEDMTEEEKFDYYAKNGSYYLGGMNSDEIVTVVNNLLEKFPENGEKYDEMIEKYNSPVAFTEQNIHLNLRADDIPINHREKPGLYAGTGSLAIDYNEINGSDYILKECHKYCFEKQMDGTVTPGLWLDSVKIYPEVSVELCLCDYEKAAEVYEKLVENEKAFHIYDDSEKEDKREGSVWHISFNEYDGSQQARSGRVNLQLMTDNCYLLTVYRYFEKDSLFPPVSNDNQ